MPEPIAIWNSARDVWETPGAKGFFCEHLDVFSETFPTSGMTVNGAAYELPTWGGAIPDTGSSSLLPTVTVQDSENTGGPSQFSRNTPPLNARVMMLETPTAALAGGVQTLEQQVGGRQKAKKLLPTPSANLGENGGSQHPDKRRAGNHQASIQDVAEHLLLPTPRCGAGMNRNLRPHAVDASRLEDAVATKLLPTPTVGMMMGGSATRSGARSTELLLPGVAQSLAPMSSPADGAPVKLLPTTRAQHGEDRNQNVYPRALDKPQNLENSLARLPGESTSQPSGDGKASSDNQLPGQLNLLDELADTD